MRQKTLFLTTIFFICFFNIAFASTQNNWKTQTQNMFNQWRTENHIPGASLTILNMNQNKFANFYSGTTTRDGQQEVDDNALFQIGSITKTFIAAIMLQFEAERRLNLKDPIGAWFPEYPRWRNITIKQLLNMTSGIYNVSQSINLMQTSYNAQTRQWKPRDLINRAYQHKDEFLPGKNWGYSNTNYLLLGMLIERATGEPLHTVIEKTLLQKLNLKNTFYLPKPYPAKVSSRMVNGYRDNTDITEINMSSYGAASAMVSRTQDIAFWINDLFSGKVLSADQLKKMMTTVSIVKTPPIPPQSRYGLGIYSEDISGLGTVWWYSGVTEGYISLFAYIPATKIVFAVATDYRDNNNLGLLMPGSVLFEKLIAMMKESNNFDFVKK